MVPQIPGGCLTDLNNAAAGHNGVVLGPCNGGAAQAWTALPGGTVRSRPSGGR
ncbi:MAG: RICIN domain-containing protein [Actinomycetota bacterium]|nr:RICIN domain-containing protein [Actinomycetota bacterium]